MQEKTDMLVRLYDLPDDWGFIGEQARLGITIRKPFGPEKNLLLRWVGERFAATWVSETNVATYSFPMTCFIAVENHAIVGFACYDATALGFFGPTGVAEECRGKGTGKALLLACLLDMKLKGYGYAVIGWVASEEYYAKAVGATVIPGSSASVWKTWVPDI